MFLEGLSCQAWGACQLERRAVALGQQASLKEQVSRTMRTMSWRWS